MSAEWHFCGAGQPTSRRNGMRAIQRSAAEDRRATRWVTGISAAAFVLLALVYAHKAHAAFHKGLMPPGYHTLMVTTLFVQAVCAVWLATSAWYDIRMHRPLWKTWALFGLTLLVCLLNSTLLGVYIR